MAILNWYNQESGTIVFMLEFEESSIESEFSELVYGLIENAESYALRKDREMKELIKSSHEDMRYMRTEYQETVTRLEETEDSLRVTSEELADYKHDYVPPASRRNGKSVLEWEDLQIFSKDKSLAEEVE